MVNGVTLGRTLHGDTYLHIGALHREDQCLIDDKTNEGMMNTDYNDFGHSLV